MDRFSQDSPADLARNYRRAREPFYAEAMPCEVCGEPCQELTYNAERHAFIGKNCSCVAIPEQPIICPALWAIYENPPCETLGELSQLVRTHKAHCEVCQSPGRKGAQREEGERQAERRSA